MTKKRALEDIVRKVVLASFKGLRVSDVLVDPGRDHDGDPVYYVKIIVEDADVKLIDARIASGLVRLLLPQMIEYEYEGFPILSFIAKSEWKEGSSAAA